MVYVIISKFRNRQFRNVGYGTDGYGTKIQRIVEATKGRASFLN